MLIMKDWHPANHISFASNNEHADPFTERMVKGKDGKEIVQKMWPDHCVSLYHSLELSSPITDESFSLDRFKVAMALR